MRELKRIIFVDDDQDLLTIIKYCMNELPEVECLYLTTGEDAIKETLERRPDLIFLDVMMPRMDGLTTLKSLRLIPSCAKIPVVFFTAKVQPAEVESYFKMGVIDVITKPFDALTLPTRIKNIWEKYEQH